MSRRALPFDVRMPCDALLNLSGVVVCGLRLWASEAVWRGLPCDAWLRLSSPVEGAPLMVWSWEEQLVACREPRLFGAPHRVPSGAHVRLEVGGVGSLLGLHAMLLLVVEGGS